MKYYEIVTFHEITLGKNKRTLTIFSVNDIKNINYVCKNKNQKKNRRGNKMKIHKKIVLTLLCAVFLIGIHNYVSADNENISYKAEYDSSTTYKLTITGLEYEEGYNYYAMICQETDVTGSDFFH